MTQLRLGLCAASLFFTIGGMSLGHSAPDDVRTKIAYIQGRELFVLDGLDLVARQTTHDNIWKYSPAWSPDGMHIAFMAAVDPNTLPLLTIVDTAGQVQTQRAIFPGRTPGTSTPEVTPRSIGVQQWVDDKHIALEGSINRWVCDFRVIDIGNGEITREQLGQCGTFQFSPDFKHVLEESNLRAGPEVNFRDGLAMDGSNFYPKSGPLSVRFLVPASWSPDGRFVAVIEHDVESGQRRLAILDLSGRVRLAVIPSSSMEDFEKPEWFDGEVLVQQGTAGFSMKPDEEKLAPSRDSLISAARERRGQRKALEHLRKSRTRTIQSDCCEPAIWISGAGSSQ